VPAQLRPEDPRRNLQRFALVGKIIDQSRLRVKPSPGTHFCITGNKSMSLFLLDEETIERITNELPKLDGSDMAVMKLAPDFISIRYPAESNIPIAAVCLQDTLHALLQVRLGLNECFRHKIWYQEKCSPPNEKLAVIFMRFYIDAIVSQLYAAGEHLANAIICLLDLAEGQLEKYRNNRVSQQSILGHYLANEEADNPITKAVLELAGSKEWRKTMDYRNNWVHEQPPTVSGLGSVYRRCRRWIRSEDGKSFKLGLGSGDDPEYSVDEILKFVQPAILQFVDLFDKVVSIYLDVIGKRGIILTEGGLQVKIIGKMTGT
jgi:hypothetical protein